MSGFDINNLVVDKVLTVRTVQAKCHVCGFDNSNKDTFEICPICQTNLIVHKANISEGDTFCGTFVFGK